MKKVTAVFWYTAVICLVVVLWGIIAPKNLDTVSGNVQAYISSKFGWYYLILVTLLLIFCIYLIFSPFGKIKLGKPDEKPEYRYLTWIAMLFSAGMGIGMVFWTTAEPISHAFKNPPLAKAGSDEAIKQSLQYAFFHWGLHAWAIYALVALALAYFKFHKGAPGLISATLEPLFGEKSMRGSAGKIIDTLAVFATIVGVAATLGFGAAQINGGLSYLLGVPNSFWVQLLIIVVVTVLFLISAWSGISKGIKYLSNINMGLAVILLIMLFILGPTLYILNMFTNTLGTYLTNLFKMSFRLAPLNHQHRQWINNWTIFYWAWWIAWAPFVGIFIARVSRGRTIREFISGVLIVPSVVCFLFFSVFGVSALNLQQHGIAKISKLPLETTTFGVLAHYPLGGVMSVLTIILIGTFFITSADSATFVLGMQSTGGSLNPANSVKLVWGIAQSAIAAILLYSGGLQGLQNVLIVAALPFSIIMLLMAISFYKAVSTEHRKMKAAHQKPKKHLKGEAEPEPSPE